MGWSELMEQVEAETVERERLAEVGVVNKGAGTAWGWWLILGWIGAHRFYLRKRGWLPLLWQAFALSVLVPFLPGENAGPATWFIGTLCLWLADAFFIPGWVRSYQTAYAEAARKLQTEDMAEELTIPLLRAAQKHGGTLTVTQAVLATGLPFTDVERCLTELATTGYVEIENTDDGSLLFVFGDLPEPEPGELEAYAEAEANALALAEVAEAMEHERAELEEAEKRARRGAVGSSAVRGAVSGLAAFGLHALLDDDE